MRPSRARNILSLVENLIERQPEESPRSESPKHDITPTKENESPTQGTITETPRRQDINRPKRTLVLTEEWVSLHFDRSMEETDLTGGDGGGDTYLPLQQNNTPEPEHNTAITQLNINESVNALVPYSESDSDVSTNDKYTRQNVRRDSSQSSSSSTSSSCSSSSSSKSSDSKKSFHFPQPDNVLDENNVSSPQPVLDLELRNAPVNRRYRTSTNYQISPVCSDESDVDLSDEDPTFIAQTRTRQRNFLFQQSDDDSSDKSTTGTDVIQRGRKRTKNIDNWKQNKTKRRRNKGSSYVSMAKSKKIIPARCLKEPCTDKCRQKCSQNINSEQRYAIFEKFWGLGDLYKQRAYIKSCMTEIIPKYKYTNAEKPRYNNMAYHFVVEGRQIRVCKKFFKATLDVSDRMILTIQTKFRENGFEYEDLRGKHGNHKHIDPEILTAMKDFINSIPRIESHYLRASTTREFIPGDKNIKDIFKDFKEARELENKEAGSYITFYKVFSTFNISFHLPKCDTCDLCESYKNATGAQKSEIEEKYESHRLERKLCRAEKKKDRKDIRSNKNLVVAVYDLQAVLQCPRGYTSSFYYLSKLNCLNFTITELKDDKSKVAYENVHSYFWTEVDANRGAIEIGTCVWQYLHNIHEEGGEAKEVIFYSDNCAGQNKNKYVTSMYMFAVEHLNIKSITHKFLIRGHTYNEADSVHGIIEKEIKKNLNGGPIYTPDQYVAIIKQAKKSKQIKMHEMSFDNFFDLKKLQEEWGYNFSINTDGNNVIWNDIKVLKVTKTNPLVISYKKSYTQEQYSVVEVRNKRKKVKPINEISLNPAYTEKQPLSSNKKKDLREMISKSLIPGFYTTFFESLF